MWLIRSVNKAIWPSIEPVLVAFAPKLVKIPAFFSIVKYGIFVFLITSLLCFFFKLEAKVQRNIDFKLAN